jgi:hypothetical protein
MAVARWADVSEHNNKIINALYKLLWFAYRVCDGTYRDMNFKANDAYVVQSKLIGYIVYFVWPRSKGSCSWQEAFATLQSMLGNHHRPRMVVMQDVETWSRAELRKDFSAGLEAQRHAIVLWLNSLRPAYQKQWPLRAWYFRQDNRRVIGYGNRDDLKVMAGGATKVRWRNIILADYRRDVPTPKVYLGWNVAGRQHTNGLVGDPPHGTPPWPTCDMNRAEVDARTLAAKLGLGVLRWSLK